MASADLSLAQSVLDFWFKELTPVDWWKKSVGLDKQISARFFALHAHANQCELFSWRETPQGRLAEVIVLDQFSRNMFRNKPESFASDALALALAQEAVACGDDQKLTVIERGFLYLPYMHSESLVIHDVALKLYKIKGLESNYDFAVKHRNIIEKFGRYPHRNAILGRASTPTEIEFLKQPGSGF